MYTWLPWKYVFGMSTSMFGLHVNSRWCVAMSFLWRVNGVFARANWITIVEV